MTTIVIRDRQQGLEFSSCGHSSREVCIALSALINALVQHAQDTEDKNSASVYREYREGFVYLDMEFRNKAEKTEFMREITALMKGFELYEHQFPDEIKLNLSL